MNNIENIKNQINAQAHSPEQKKPAFRLESPSSENLFKSPCKQELEDTVI